MARNYTPLLHSYLREMSDLTDEEFGRLARALLAYSANGGKDKHRPDGLTGNEAFYWVRVTDADDQFRDEYARKCKKNQENGKKGGRPRKRPAEENPKNQTVFSKPNTIQYNTTQYNTTLSPQAPLTEGGQERAMTQQAEGFDKLWNIYPTHRRCGKQAAQKAWSRLNPDTELTKVILNAVEYQKQQDEWIREDGRYVPALTKYIQEQRWDEVPAGARADPQNDDVLWIRNFMAAHREEIGSMEEGQGC